MTQWCVVTRCGNIAEYAVTWSWDAEGDDDPGAQNEPMCAFHRASYKGVVDAVGSGAMYHEARLDIAYPS